VFQDCAAAPEKWTSHAFEPEWAARPGGIVALTAMLNLRHTADAHGGKLSVDADGRGTRITLILPAYR
jgi:hypothetical protein